MIALETHALSIGYNRTPVAAGLNLTLREGELVALLGPNGIGKSTLMRTLAGMQPALAGQVTLAGQALHTLTPRQLAQQLSIVLTERPNLGLLNGYALVALGRHPYTDWLGRLTRQDEAVIRWAVEAVGATDLATRPVMELSDGQRQKFMIARALAQESALILLDEPTAYLDLPRRVEIMQLLKSLAHETGRAILVSTHDLDLALRSADGLWLMSGGQVRTGTPEDLVLNGQFEAAFRGEGVTFDRETGAFNLEATANGRVAVVGEGIPHTWTRRALERAGFTVTPGGAETCIEIDGDEAQPRWTLHRDGATQTYTSIAALLAALR